MNKEFGDAYGIEVLDASIIDVHPDKKLKEAIDNRVTALQQKQQTEAEQEKIKVEAETKEINMDAQTHSFPSPPMTGPMYPIVVSSSCTGG